MICSPGVRMIRCERNLEGASQMHQWNDLRQSEVSRLFISPPKLPFHGLDI